MKGEGMFRDMSVFIAADEARSREKGKGEGTIEG